MWLYMNNAIISVVENMNNSNELLVRSRYLHHLQKLLDFNGTEESSAAVHDGKIKIFEDDFADYRYRAYVEKRVFSELIAKRVLEIDYSSYKASIHEESPELKPLLNRIHVANKVYEMSVTAS